MEGAVAQRSVRYVLRWFWLCLAARHGAGSRKAALKPSMSLYGNDVTRHRFLLSDPRNVVYWRPPVDSWSNCSLLTASELIAADVGNGCDP